MNTTEPHPALAHRCPFCHADPGQPCRKHRGRSNIEADRTHSRRVALTRPAVERQPAAVVPALCCVCGEQRTVSEDYHRVQDPNYSYGATARREGWRKTQTLKCDACGDRTRHAILDAADSLSRDYGEQRQRYILGGDWPDKKYAPDRERLRAEYFAQFPRNPYLQHRYWVSEARTAWQDGTKVVTAVCGASITLSCDPDDYRTDQTELVAPSEVRDDQEYEDSTTGLWWVEMDCVDCIRVANASRLKNLRNLLLADLLQVANVVPDLDAVQVGELREHLGRLMDRARTT